MINPAQADLQDRRLGLVALGASRFSHFTGYDNEAFEGSKRAFCAALRDAELSLFADRVDFLDLFNAPESPREIYVQIREFLTSYSALTDVLFYYCGHGEFDHNRKYGLLLQNSEPEMFEITSLQPRVLKDVLELHLRRKRVYLFLDCCYAGEAAREWMSGDSQSLVMTQWREVFAESGTALATAASKSSVAIAPKGQPLTMFTGSFLDALRVGLRNGQRYLSLRDVIDATRHLIYERYGSLRAVPPELHSPGQERGDVARIPLFFNQSFETTTDPWLRGEIDNLLALLLVDRPGRREALGAVAKIPLELVDAALQATIVGKLRNLAANDDSYSVRDLAVVGRAERSRPTNPQTSNPALRVRSLTSQ